MRKRIFSAVIVLIVFAPMIALGGNLFKVGIVGAAILGLREIINILKKNNNIPIIVELISYILLGSIIISEEYILSLIGATILLSLIPMIFYKEDEYNFETASRLLGSILLLGYAFYVMNSLRIASLHMTIFIILVPVLTDTAAFVFGKIIGKHKLSPRVSPNKTIEGALAGLFIGSLFPTIYYVCFVDKSEKFFDILIISIILSIFGQLGDLVFSSIKRRFKVKDFSNLIPGHGGILDLFDSLIFVLITYSVVSTII